VFTGDASDDTHPYQRWFHSVENNVKWHCTDIEADIAKIISISGMMDAKASSWYAARAEYMKKYFKVDEWNPFLSAMEKRFLDSQEERNALGQMRELKYKEDIESHLTDMETLNYEVCLVGTLRRTLLRDGLSQHLQYHLSTTKYEAQNDTDYVESIRRVGLAMDEFLMLQKKHSSKDSSVSNKKKDKKSKRQEERDKRENKPKDRGLGGKSGSKKPQKEDQTKHQISGEISCR
jgi:hypothetical protein